MNKEKIIDLIVELIKEFDIEEEFLNRLEQKDKVIKGKENVIQKWSNELKWKEAQDLPEAPKPTEKDIIRAMQELTREKRTGTKGNPWISAFQKTL